MPPLTAAPNSRRSARQMPSERYRSYRRLSAAIQLAFDLANFLLAAALYLLLMVYFVAPHIFSTLEWLDSWFFSDSDPWYLFIPKSLLSVLVAFFGIYLFYRPAVWLYKLIRFNLDPLRRRLSASLDSWYDQTR